MAPGRDARLPLGSVRSEVRKAKTPPGRYPTVYENRSYELHQGGNSSIWLDIILYMITVMSRLIH